MTINVKLHNEEIYLTVKVSESQIFDVSVHPDSGFGLKLDDNLVIAKSVFLKNDIDVKYILKRFKAHVYDLSNIIAYDNGVMKYIFILHKGDKIVTYYKESLKKTKELVSLLEEQNKKQFVDLWVIAIKNN